MNFSAAAVNIAEKCKKCLSFLRKSYIIVSIWVLSREYEVKGIDFNEKV